MFGFLQNRVADSAIIAAAALFGFVLIVKLAFEPRDPSQAVAVVFAPWLDESTTLSRAAEIGGRFVRFGGYSFIAVIAPDDNGYISRARAKGAWLLADPRALGACLDRLTGKRL